MSLSVVLVTLTILAVLLIVFAILTVAAAGQIERSVEALVPERRHDADCAACCANCQARFHDKGCESEVASQ